IGGLRLPFYGREIADLPLFVSRLTQRSLSDPISAYLAGNLRAITRQFLLRYQESKSDQASQRGGYESLESNDAEVCLKRELSTDLHRLTKGPCIYETERFQGIRLSPEVQSMLTEPLEGEKLEELNRLLLEAAYPRELLQRGKQPDFGAKCWDLFSSTVL